MIYRIIKSINNKYKFILGEEHDDYENINSLDTIHFYLGY